VSSYNIADTERVYRMAREYTEETNRYIRMCQEATPERKETLGNLIRSVDAVGAMLQSLKVEWQDTLRLDHNADWDVQ
jgi:hypothetical protein